MLYENIQDKENEREILASAQEIFTPFKDVLFRQNYGTVHWDFTGHQNGEVVLQADVKVREILPNKYNSYFVALEKIKTMDLNPNIGYYILYYFSPEKLVRIFDLNKLEAWDIETQDITFTHKRSGETYSKKLVPIPARRFALEYYLT